MTAHRRTAALHNLGCKVNAYETESMQQQLEEAGYTIVPFAPGADVYLVNTCTVTNIADRKSRQMLHRAKKMNPSAIVVAVGCYVQAAMEKTGLAVEADIIIGNNQKSRLVEILDEFWESRRAAAEEEQRSRTLVTQSSTHSQYEEMKLSRTSEHTRAYIKVQDGCSQYCTYCLIPFARGKARSRRSADVVREVRDLARTGIQEIVLTGIHLSSYGKDLEGGEDLLRLIRETAATEGIERVRLGSLEPGIITEEFVRGISGIKEFCPHFHLSLQSGSDTVLRRMNRRYTSSEFEERCRLLRTYFDDPALTTDVITGFPGETEEEFEQTRGFLEKIRFYETHVFKYSKREGTAAARMSGQLTEKVKSERSDVLLAMNEVNRKAYEERLAKRPAEILLEEEKTIGGEKYMIGHTREYIRAAMPVSSDETTASLRGRILKGRISYPGPDEETLIFTADIRD